MAVRNQAEQPLPASYVFFTVARGRSHRTFMARTGLVFGALAMLPVLLVWLVGSTLYITFHDTLASSLMLHERDMQYAYEDRIASLRSQLDSQASKALVTERSIATKLEELTAREAELAARSHIVLELDQEIGRPIAPKDRSSSPWTVGTSSPAAAPTGLTGEASAPRWVRPGEDHAALAVSSRLVALASGLDAVSNAQDEHMVRLGQAVTALKTRLDDAIETTGLDPDRLLAGQPKEQTGGPFIPLPARDDASPFSRATVGVQLGLSEVGRLKAAIAHVPLNKPLHGDPDVTSSFGARVDPFLGRPAMHTGIDLAEETGTGVLATAPGKVTFAGEASGYGLMVEVDHGAGLATRYAHLSEISTAVGAHVDQGDVVGHVGATGRATGPHLHYETRIDGEAVDPMRFLAAGRKLFGNRDTL